MSKDKRPEDSDSERSSESESDSSDDEEEEEVNFFDDFDVKNELGRGNFSVVMRAIDRETGETVAVKIVDKKSLDEGDQSSKLAMEINILKQVKHPSIIALKSVYDSPDRIYIVMEMVTGGELFDKIVESGSYSEKDASELVSKVVSACLYLHERNIVHRDLKPENLLLSSPDDPTSVKIADFGLSKIIGEGSLLETACGTPYYVAPEVLSCKSYDKAVDMWSIGVVTYLLLCGFPPFFAEDVPEVFEQIMTADFDFPDPYWTTISSEAKDFIEGLLCTNPAKRMTAKQALTHPWLKGTQSSKEITYKNKKSRSFFAYKKKSRSQLKNKTKS